LEAGCGNEDGKLLAEIRKIGPLPGYPQKICPFCIQPIPLDATVCKFCTRTVNTEEEVTDLLRTYFKKVLGEKRRKRWLIIGFFAVVIIVWALSKR
jgi:hypothetical protein